MNESLVQEGYVTIKGNRIRLVDIANSLAYFKISGYAEGAEPERFGSGFKRIILTDERFFYADEWYGFRESNGFGTEVLTWLEAGTRLWAMNYFGGMGSEFVHDEELTRRAFNVLRKALSRVTRERPFRGPEVPFSDDGLTYICRTRGDFSKFSGKEEIYTPSLGMIYSLNFHGGLLVPNDT